MTRALVRGAQALGFLVALAGSARADEVFERDAVNVSAPPGVDISRVSVDNRLGDVTVRGHDHEGIVVHAFKRAPDDETLERLVVSLVPEPGGPVSIRTSLLAGLESRPIPAGAVEVDLVVLVPRSARVRAEVWNGSIEVEGVDNGAELAANEGEIDVKQVSGEVSTHIAHGPQELAEIFGAVDARGVESDLDLEEVIGSRLAASVYRGRVSARHVRVRELSVRTIHGSVRLEGTLLAGGHYRVSAYRGNLELRVRSEFGLRVMARSKSGQVRLPKVLAARRAATGAFFGAYGSGRSPAELQLTTGMGHITLAEF